MNREQVCAYVLEVYGTEPDEPWHDSNAVLRHAVTGKWYGLLLTVRRDRMGLKGEGTVEVLNLKCDPLLVGSLRMKPGFRPAYHMNKEQWISVLLDEAETPEDDEVRMLIDLSWQATRTKTKTAPKSDGSRG